MKEPYPSAARCAYELCQRCDIIEVIPGHRRKQYHDEACRQAQHRLLETRHIHETLRQVWSPFLPKTQLFLEDLLAQHGEVWVRRTIAAITDERDQAGQPSLSEDEQAALRQQWADLQPFTCNILEGLLTQQHEPLGLLNLITLAIGEERTHAMCNSELEQRAAYLEIKLADYRRIIDLEDEEKIGQQFMVMGDLLGYRALPSYRLGEGIERWKDYRSWTDERTLAEVIVYARELLAQEAAVKETAAQKSKMRQAEQRLVALEYKAKEQQERIAELERQAELNDQARTELETARAQAEQGLDQVQQRFKQHVRLTNEKLSQLTGELVELRQEQAGWVAWKEAEIVLHTQLTAMQRYLREHSDAAIPIVRSGVTLKIVALGNDSLAVSEDHGLVRLSDDELEQGRIWVAQKTGVPILATRQPIGGKRDREGGTNRELLFWEPSCCSSLAVDPPPSIAFRRKPGSIWSHFAPAAGAVIGP